MCSKKSPNDSRVRIEPAPTFTTIAPSASISHRHAEPSRAMTQASVEDPSKRKAAVRGAAWPSREPEGGEEQAGRIANNESTDTRIAFRVIASE
ncbi:MAG: hypothetical protein AMXMBFR77_22550 [Phycisphaerales bacterium]|nr:MAG: hypothetical protein BroJett004_05970 [Planctomycetota bacterium]